MTAQEGRHGSVLLTPMRRPNGSVSNTLPEHMLHRKRSSVVHLGFRGNQSAASPAPTSGGHRRMASRAMLNNNPDHSPQVLLRRATAADSDSVKSPRAMASSSGAGDTLTLPSVLFRKATAPL